MGEILEFFVSLMREFKNGFKEKLKFQQSLKEKKHQGREQANLSSFSEEESRGEKEKSPIIYHGKSEKVQNVRESMFRKRQKRKESYTTLNKLEKLADCVATWL